MSLKIVKFDPQTASVADFADLTAFRNVMRTEIDPSASPTSVEHTMNNLKNFPPVATLHLWLAFKDEKLVGASSILIIDFEENKHLAQASVQVLAEYRQQGIAKKLLNPLLEVAETNNKELLIDDTNSRVSAGEALMKRLNAKEGLATHINQLLLTELNKDLMETWQSQAKERNQDFELLRFQNSIPEKEIAAYCLMKDLMNTQPLGDLDVQDMKTTADFIRQQEAHRQAKGDKHWTLIAKHKTTGDFAGYTETLWNPDDPLTLHQDDTAVMPKYRGHGLGKWLKASMLENVMQELPQLQRVRTGNADSNDAMLRINTQMGFKPFQASTLWQVKVTELKNYLES